jgi:hypothetical protein
MRKFVLVDLHDHDFFLRVIDAQITLETDSTGKATVRSGTETELPVGAEP